MATNKPQFDVFLGGCHELPVDMSVRRFVSARAQEIAALTQAIEDPQRTGLVFQKLPKHMRRRVMSRSSKRLPRRLREAHMHQLTKSGLPPKPKRPSRKYRRRPRNLLLEYNRRQKKFIWLETHIWHAKRFHMTEKWGYKLADFPNDKSFRACYRATANHCLLQDISYYNCIELNGPEYQLLEHLQILTSKDCGFTFGAKAFLKGTQEGSVMLFHQNSYPFRAIGRVSFLWKSLPEVKCEVKQDRTLWIWVHPAFYQEVLDELISLFAFTEKTSPLDQDICLDVQSEPLSECPSSDIEDSEQCESPVKKKQKVEGVKKKKDIESIKLFVKNVQFTRTPKYQSSDGSVEMILLKDVLNRFRLTGPLSQAALLESLQVTNILEIADTENDEVDKKDWWQEYYGTSEENKASWKYQKMVWETFKGATSPSQLPPHFVLALTVNDPRLQLPSKRKKAVPDDDALWDKQSTEQMTQLSPLACVSPIWSLKVRDLVTKCKLSAAELADIRSHSLVPGNTLEELGMDIEDVNNTAVADKIVNVKSCIPVLLIQRPGSQDAAQKRLGYSSGWDIVLPAGWALPFWLGLVFRGARAGGLRETQSVEFETNSEHLFPPDTEAGSKVAECIQAKLTEQHFRLPPDKRPNFLKLGFSSPFTCAWQVLVNDWTHSSSMSPVNKSKMDNMSVNTAQFFVLRDKKNVECLKLAIESLKAKREVYDNDIVSSLAITNTNSCLVKLAVYMCGRGKPSDGAIICIPSINDVDNILKNSNFQGPVEELHRDDNEVERRNLRIEHKKLLRSLRRKRVKEKLKQENFNAEKSDGENDVEKPTHARVSAKRKKNEPPPTKDIIDRHAEKMQSLWLPQTKTVKDFCSREVMGFIMKGDFSFTESRGVGHGYVVLPALLKLIIFCRRSKESNKLMQPWVLIRNPTSLQYRFGIIHV